MAFPLPGYYLGLRGEATHEEYNELVLQQPLHQVFDQIFYGGIDTGEYYQRTFPQFFHELQPWYRRNEAYLRVTKIVN